MLSVFTLWFKRVIDCLRRVTCKVNCSNVNINFHFPFEYLIAYFNLLTYDTTQEKTPINVIPVGYVVHMNSTVTRPHKAQYPIASRVWSSSDREVLE